MPLYEGIGLINKKHTVVIDLGQAYTKCGFTGENGPRHILPSQVLDSRSKMMCKIWDYKNGSHLHCLLTDFLQSIYYRHLLVSPKDRTVVIVESVLCPTIFRETLAKVLFRHYEVSSILFAPSHLMALYTLGIPSALVVDVGYTGTHVIPVFEGEVMINSGEEYNLGSKMLHDHLKILLTESLDANAMPDLQECLTDDVLEDIKVRTCFVRPFKYKNPSSGKTENVPTPPNVQYPLKFSRTLLIQGTVRERAADVLFDVDGEEKSLAILILDTIIKCPVDMRQTLVENIVVMGGTAMLPGFRHRLIAEFKDLLSNNKYSGNRCLQNFKFHNPPAKENYVAFLGAAIFAATDAVKSRSITRNQYMQEGRIPDWTDGNARFVNDEHNL